MATICDDVARLTKEIRELLREQARTKLNQTASLDGYKVTDTKASVGAYRRMPKGKAIIYTGIEPTLEPTARDVEEMARQNRPFMCRAVRMFAKDEVACYAPSREMFSFIKDNIVSLEKSGKALQDVIYNKWGVTTPQTKAEKALRRELSLRRYELRRTLNPAKPKEPEEEYKPGLASVALRKCSFILR